MNLEAFLEFISLVLAVALLLPFFRVIKGPTLFDRMAGLSVIGSKTIVLLALVGALYARLDMFVDIVIDRNLSMLLQGAIVAEEKVGLKMNILKRKLDAALKILPSLNAPTVSELSDSQWISIEVIVDETIVRDILPQLKRSGATGIVEYPLNKVIF